MSPDVSPDASCNRALDAVALLAASLQGDRDSLYILFGTPDDVEHWKGVASVLAGLLAGALRDKDYEGYLKWQRERILDGGGHMTPSTQL